MTITSNNVANQAIMLIGDNQPLVTGYAPNFDNSAAGIALSKIYIPAVRTVMRQFAWDFARNTQALTLSGNPAPWPWAYEYVYPAYAVQVLQVMPPTLADPFDPLPEQWSVGNDEVDGTQTKVIWSNTANAQVVCNNVPTESLWDPLFHEAVVRLIASELALAIAAKPDTAQVLIQSGGAFENLGESRKDV